MAWTLGIHFFGKWHHPLQVDVGGTSLSPTFSASHILSVNRDKKSALPHGSVFHITGFEVLGYHGKGAGILSARYR